MSERKAHQWDTSGVRRMKIVEESSISSSIKDQASILDVSTSERYIEQLKKFSLEEVGNSKWIEQHQIIEKLNMQAHHCALSNHDEFVVEAFITFKKIDALIHDLLVMEAWKEKIFPLLIDHLAENNSMRTYFILYHEATLVNLLEVLFYHPHVCESVGEKLLEVVDYLARKLTKLNGGYDFRSLDTLQSNGGTPLQVSTQLASRTHLQELQQQHDEIEFKVCISACSLVRFLCEHVDSLPLSVSSRITDTHDFLILIIPLIENPPWTRRTNGRWQKLIDNKWSDVAPIDLLKVTKLEGQPWLSFYSLLAKKAFRERYQLNSFRKSQVLRIRKYINDVLLDQLPFLADIQRYMDELAITETVDGGGSNNNVFLFQQVAVEREKLLKGKDFPAIAALQLKHVFTMTDRDDPDLQRIVALYVDDMPTDDL